MIDFRYVLIRYVADRERMEPINVGVILQGNGRLDMRFSPHAAKRKDIDTSVFRQWRQFFETEIHGPGAPLFHPERTSPAFLEYLRGLCEGAVLLNRPLLLSADSTRGFEQVLDSLYGRLVAPPEVVSPDAATRPTGRFRQLAEERDFVNRGMKRHAHVFVKGRPLWMAYRQVLNGQAIAFDKVEVANQIGATSYEIERLPLIADRLQNFVGARIGGKPTRYLLLADELSHPFTDQSDDEFKAMRSDLEEAVERIKKQGGAIIRRAAQAEEFADEINERLPRTDRDTD